MFFGILLDILKIKGILYHNLEVYSMVYLVVEIHGGAVRFLNNIGAVV